MRLRNVSVDEKSGTFDFWFKPGNVYVLRNFSRRWRRYWVGVLLGIQTLNKGTVDWPVGGFIFEAPEACWKMTRELGNRGVGEKLIVNNVSPDSSETVMEAIWAIEPDIGEAIKEYEQLVSKLVMHDSDQLRVAELEALLIERNGWDTEKRLRALLSFTGVDEELTAQWMELLGAEDRGRTGLSRLLGWAEVDATRTDMSRDTFFMLMEPERVLTIDALERLASWIGDYPGPVIIGTERYDWLESIQTQRIWLDCIDGRLFMERG